MWRIEAALLFSCLALAVSGPLLGRQVPCGRLEGRIESLLLGSPLAGVTLILNGLDGGILRETASGGDGSYRFECLPVGLYRLQILAEGYEPESREIHIQEAQGSSLEFQLIEERTTLGQVEARGAEERNPNIFIRRVDFNVLRDALIRRGIEPVFLEFTALENDYGTDLGAPLRQILFVRPDDPRREFHFSLYEAHQNSALNARPFFNVGDLRAFKRNQFGLAASGPPIGDRLSFHTGLDFVRESGFVNGNIRAPRLDERTPTSQDPQAAAIVTALLQAYPPEEPNLPGVAPRQLNTNAIRRIDSVNWNQKLDYVLSERDKLAFQYTLFDYAEDPFELVLGQNPRTELRSQTFSLSHTHSGSPRETLQAAFQFDRLKALLLITERFQALLRPLGFEQAPDVGFGGGFADLSGIGPGGQFPRQRFQNRFSGNLDVALQRGRHRWHLGGRTTRLQLNDLQSDNSRGSFQFGDNFGRSTVENFLLGTPTSFSITRGNLFRGFRNWEHALYVQDTFQVRSGLTLNWGLRYELVTVPKEVNNLTDFPNQTDANNLGPHVALAWRPSQGSLVVRTGYSIAFGHIFPGVYQTQRFNPPAVQSITVQAPSLVDPLDGLSLEAGAAERSERNVLSPDLVSPYTHQWNFRLQGRLPANFSYEVGYVGHRTVKPFFKLITNRAEPIPGIPATTATIDERRPDSNSLRIKTITNTGTFSYDALKARLSRFLTGGPTLDLEYIFSKSMTNSAFDFSSTLNGGEPGGFIVSQNNENLFADLKSPSALDHRHILIARYSYELPFTFSGNFLSHLLEKWTISGMTEFRTGAWFIVKTSSDAPGFGNVDGEGLDRPNITNLAILGETIDDPDTSTEILDPGFFNTDIAPGGRGNLGLRVFRSDPVNNTNLALTKAFPLPSGGSSLEFRVEFRNFFNHPHFAEPGDLFPSTIFGKIVDTQNRGRAMEFMLRLDF